VEVSRGGCHAGAIRRGAAMPPPPIVYDAVPPRRFSRPRACRCAVRAESGVRVSFFHEGVLRWLMARRQNIRLSRCISSHHAMARRGRRPSADRRPPATPPSARAEEQSSRDMKEERRHELRRVAERR